MNYILTVLDTVSIQKYIFSTNKLQEMIGASELVEVATQEWVYECLFDLFKENHNLTSRAGGLDEQRVIENEALGLQAELIYAGGGNTLLLFRDMDCARAFTARLTRRALIEAPGLQIAVAHLPFEWSEGSLGAKMIDLIEKRLAQRKLVRSDAQPLGALGVTMPCQSTGGPAAWLSAETPPRRISRETAAKLGLVDRHNARLRRTFGQQLEGVYDFPQDFDQLVPFERSESYLAVVHADGNGMGRRVRSIAMQAGNNRTFINNMRAFSTSVRAASTAALGAAVVALARMNPDDLSPRGKRLPLRPLISGGDDVTFVCRGDLGVSLAALFLEHYEQAVLEGLPRKTDAPNEPIHPHACAGISIVKLHFPFSLAYELAECLCSEAKQEIPAGEDFSVLDWHFSSTGISGSLEDIRRAYTSASGARLNLRPLRLRPQPYDVDGRAWLERVEPLVAEFHKKWSGARNKVKDLHEALREGPEEVKEFLHTYQLASLPALIPGVNTYVDTGWGDRCGYFDALELMDHFTRVG